MSIIIKYLYTYIILHVLCTYILLCIIYLLLYVMHIMYTKFRFLPLAVVNKLTPPPEWYALFSFLN